jgi:hypothetical protein
MELSARWLAPSLSTTGARRNGSCTLAVSNLEEVTAHLESLGIDTSQRTAGEKVKTVMIADPDGNHLAFAEAMDRTMAH